MLSEREKQFIQYWEANREREHRWQQQLLAGIPMGLLFALPVIAIIFTGKLWYQRADMAMNAMANPYVLIVAVFVITVFVSIFYKATPVGHERTAIPPAESPGRAGCKRG